jgi:hypothetical protein
MTRSQIHERQIALACRAKARRIAMPAKKSAEDAQVENASFHELQNYLYKNLTQEEHP